MTSLRALNLLLVAFVLVPAAVLAWLGLEGAERLEREVEERLAERLRQAGGDLLRLAEETVALDARQAQALVEHLARLATQRLPFGRPGATLRELRLLADRGSAVSTDAVAGQAFAAAWDFSYLDLRITRAGGRREPVFPPIHDPDAPLAGSDGERLVSDLRMRADAAAYGRDDPSAALAVWDDALPRLQAAGLGARGEVERALVATAGPGTRWALSDLERGLLERHGREGLAAVGRPWVLLLLRERIAVQPPPPVVRSADLGRYAADRPSTVELQALHEAGRLDEVPLTELERARLNDVVHPAFGSRPRPDLEGEDVRRADLPHGLVLELRRRMPRPGGGREVLVQRWSRQQSGVLWLDVAFADQGEARVPAPRVRYSLALPVIGGTRPVVHLTHLQEASLLAEGAQQRHLTTVGVVSLLCVLGLGLVLTRRAVRRERAARTLQEDFLANVSHELRTPLTSVCLHADLLLEPTGDGASRRRHAEVVRAEAARLSSLVDDLLDVSALARGVRRLEPEPVDLVAAARAAWTPLLVLGEREGVSLRADLPPGETLALADPHALARILANLLSNAWKHGRPSRDGAPGRITLRIERDGGSPRLVVSDDGAGIPASARAGLFSRFHRGPDASKTRGVGLGLALSRDLARAMGGDLILVDAPDRTEFRLTLPPVPPVPPVPSLPPPPPAPPEVPASDAR